MEEIVYKEQKFIDRPSLLALYNNANWTAYTNNPDELEKAVKNSLYVLTAWHKNKLAGLIRVVGDGVTIAYIQDILVLAEHKRMGIGTKLLNTALEQFKNIRQKVLLTDDNEETRGFYESLGFESCDQGKLVSFVKMEAKNRA